MQKKKKKKKKKKKYLIEWISSNHVKWIAFNFLKKGHNLDLPVQKQYGSVDFCFAYI